MATMLERNKKVKAPRKTYAEHMEDALYREVWEDVNNEKTLKFIKKYSRHIMAVAITILIVATGWQIINRTHEQGLIDDSRAYTVARSAGDSDALMTVGSDATGGIADVAMVQAYKINNDIATLERLANDGHERDLRDWARLQIVAHRGDEMSAADVEQYLADLNTIDSPYYYSASLVIAQKYLSDGNRDAANKWLDKIINSADAPSSILVVAQTLR